MIDFTPDVFEKIIVKMLVTKGLVRDRMIPYLDDLKMFHSPEIRTIISKITKLQEQYKDFPPPSSIKMELDRVEVQSTFEECLIIDTSEFIESHLLTKIEEYFKRGKLYNILTDSVSLMSEGKFDELSEVANQMRDTLSFSFDTECGLNMFSDKSVDVMYDHFHNKDKVIASGITALDDCIEGGFHEKSLSLIAMSSNLGKSATMCAMTSNNLMDDRSVLYITLELNEKKIGERILANLFDVAINDIKHLSKDKFNSKYKAINNKLNNNLVIREFPARSANANDIIALLKELEMKQNFKPDIVYIDYLGLMVPNKLKKDENTYSEQKRVSEEVRAVAMSSSLPFVSAYQVNRSAFGSASIGMESISDSIGVVFSCDILIFGTQTPEQKEISQFSFSIAKSRYGINGTRISVGIDIPKMKLFNIDNPYESGSGDNGDFSYNQQQESHSQLDSFLSSRRKL